MSYYTAAIKALVAEKFFALCATFGAENVGMVTRAASVNRAWRSCAARRRGGANIALWDGAGADVGEVVMDEVSPLRETETGALS